MFDNVLGHDKILKELTNIVTERNISHAYVFYGPAGVGKKLVATELARALLATSNLSSTPDYTYVELEKGKQNISVEQVREKIIEDVYIAPAMSNYKVYIIDDAEKLSEEAQNALLKTLEEPPVSSIIILITSAIDLLLPTITSRTINISFNKLTDDDIVCLLKKRDITISKEILEFVSGSIGMAIKMLDTDRQAFEKVEELIYKILAKDILGAFVIIKDIDIKDKDILSYIQFLLFKNKVYKGVEIIEATRRKLSLNANEEITKTNLVVDLCKIGG